MTQEEIFIKMQGPSSDVGFVYDYLFTKHLPMATEVVCKLGGRDFHANMILTDMIVDMHNKAMYETDVLIIPSEFDFNFEIKNRYLDYSLRKS